MVQLVESRGEIPRFYAGRSVFITGATGFMGKVLLERLLTTCPDIFRLYLLMRHKRDLGPEKRLLQLKQSQVFDNLRQTNPRQLDKLVIIPGDVTTRDLGMSQESIALMQEVSVVFHTAATVKFNEQLDRAVEQNVRSALRVMDICDKLSILEAFIHVSTAYSNGELQRVEERVYPPPVTPRQLLELVDNGLHIPDDLTSQFISPKLNTYTFTKAIAEYMVQQRVRNYSTAIFRPTIVVSSLRHPFPGWVDNLNGPTGVIAGVGKGFMRVIRTRGEACGDMLPVDIAIDTLIAVAWETALDKLQEVRVYNCTTGENPINWDVFRLTINKYLREYPLDGALWYPHLKPVENKYLHKTLDFLLQTVPCHLIEYASRLVGVKSKHSLITAHQKIQLMDEVLSAFALREWHFVNDNVVRLRNRLSKDDAAVYNLDPKTIVWDEHLRDFVKGTRRYVLKEKVENIPAAKKRMRILLFLHHGSILLTAFFVLRFILNRTMQKFKNEKFLTTLMSYSLVQNNKQLHK